MKFLVDSSVDRWESGDRAFVALPPALGYRDAGFFGMAANS